MGKTRRPSVSLTEMMSSADAGAVYAGNDRASQSSEVNRRLSEKRRRSSSSDDNPYENWSTGKHIAVGFAFMCLLWGICFAGTNIMIEALLRMSKADAQHS